MATPGPNLPEPVPPPAPFGPPPPAPGRLRRSRSDRVLAGVCGGIAASLGVDPVWVRLVFVILILGSGAGVLLYLAAWILIPEETADEPAGRHPGLRATPGLVIVGLALVAVGTGLLVDRLIPGLDRVFLPLAVVAAGAGLVYLGARSQGGTHAGAGSEP